jgi:hypothetical protein
MVLKREASYLDNTMTVPPPTNRELLAWFDDERAVCSYCGEKTSVSFTGVRASFCLNCSAVSIDSVRIDLDHRITA